MRDRMANRNIWISVAGEIKNPSCCNHRAEDNESAFYDIELPKVRCPDRVTPVARELQQRAGLSTSLIRV